MTASTIHELLIFVPRPIDWQNASQLVGAQNIVN